MKMKIVSWFFIALDEKEEKVVITFDENGDCYTLMKMETVIVSHIVLMNVNGDNPHWKWNFCGNFSSHLMNKFRVCDDLSSPIYYPTFVHQVTKCLWSSALECVKLAEYPAPTCPLSSSTFTLLSSIFSSSLIFFPNQREDAMFNVCFKKWLGGAKDLLCFLCDTWDVGKK